MFHIQPRSDWTEVASIETLSIKVRKSWTSIAKMMPCTSSGGFFFFFNLSSISIVYLSIVTHQVPLTLHNPDKIITWILKWCCKLTCHNSNTVTAPTILCCCEKSYRTTWLHLHYRLYVLLEIPRVTALTKEQSQWHKQKTEKSSQSERQTDMGVAVCLFMSWGEDTGLPTPGPN